MEIDWNVDEHLFEEKHTHFIWTRQIEWVSERVRMIHLFAK